MFDTLTAVQFMEGHRENNGPPVLQEACGLPGETELTCTQPRVEHNGGVSINSNVSFPVLLPQIHRGDGSSCQHPPPGHDRG